MLGDMKDVRKWWDNKQWDCEYSYRKWKGQRKNYEI